MNPTGPMACVRLLPVHVGSHMQRSIGNAWCPRRPREGRTAVDLAHDPDRFSDERRAPGLPAALRRLSDTGFRLFTLTNNTLEIAGRQLEQAGVVDLFERRF